MARAHAASANISNGVSPPPLPAIEAPPPTEPESGHQDGEQDTGGSGLSSSSAAANGIVDGEGAASTADEPPTTADDGSRAEAWVLRGEHGGEGEHSAGAGSVPSGLSADAADCEQGPSPATVLSEMEQAARARAASKIQVRDVRYGLSAAAKSVRPYLVL